MYFDWENFQCRYYFDPRIPKPPEGWPGTTPRPPPNPPDPYAGYTPDERRALMEGKILSERRNPDGTCPEGTEEVGGGSKYCMSKRGEDQPPPRGERVPKNANGVCPNGYQPEIDMSKGGYTDFCVPQGTYDTPPDDGGGGGGGGGGGNGGLRDFYKTCPDGTVVAAGDRCPQGSVEVGTKECYMPNGSIIYVLANEPCPGGTKDEKGFAGGFVKKGRIKKRKKYQAGGIASLTRDPRLGGAVNPVDGYNFGFAGGGMAAMPEYKAGGKLLRGAGDGMSDDIPAVIRGQGVQRAALADGEFVIPADVVSHLGNGSTEAGAKKLYKMMAQIRRARTGTKKQAPRVNPDKFLPR